METNQVWSTLTALICFYLMLCVLSFGYLLVGDYLPDWQKSEVNMPTKKIKSRSAENNLVSNGVHIASGLMYNEGFDLVRSNCTGCHSGKLIAQNKATREGWAQMIDWMQATQGLWDLGSDESKILDYLVKNYAPKAIGRRSNLEQKSIDWYVLEAK